MNEEKSNLSRRTFLVAGSAIAASSLLATETKALSELKALTENNGNAPVNPALISDDPVTTEAVQTLKNKTISAAENTLIIGTETLNIRDIPGHPIVNGNDITGALTAAIDLLENTGGKILIPAGVWETNGGHLPKDAITIEGVGQNLDFTAGSEIRLKPSATNNFIFRLTGHRRNFSLRDLRVNSDTNTTATGLLIENQDGYLVTNINLENVCFVNGAYGIKVNNLNTSTTSIHFECISNSFENVSFMHCRTGFYCNIINTGFSFSNCYFRVPTSDSKSGFSTGGTALDLVYIGNISLEHCLFEGNAPLPATPAPPTDGSTILKTQYNFNNISFYDCQDENLQFAYQNATLYFPNVPLVYRNCLLQSKFLFTRAGSIVFDSCILNGRIVKDAAGTYPTDAPVRVQLLGLNYIIGSQGLVDFGNPYSVVIDEYGNRNPAVITPITTTGDRTINASRGTVNIATGGNYVTVYSVLVTPNSLVFTQLRTSDTGGAKISHVDCHGGYFVIFLTQSAATTLSIGFKIEN